MINEIRQYWDENIHDMAVTNLRPGSAGFFTDLDNYRYAKLKYLPELINFKSFKGKSMLEIGCGVGIDLVHFTRAGAVVVGIDLSETAIKLARNNFFHAGLPANLFVMNGEELDFLNDSFDLVYAHGVLPYTANPETMVSEVYRVLKPGGKAILMGYNKFSWLNALTKITKVPLEHVEAPIMRKFSFKEFKQLLKPFSKYQIVFERFPQKTHIHGNWKGKVYNNLFVRGFNLIPRSLVRPFGWHLIGFTIK